MTSLTETLPILDDAVPALPGKVEAVAKEADAFHQAAATTLATFHQRRQGAEALVEQVRQALAALHDQATGEQGEVETAVQSLQQSTEQETQGIDDGEQELTTAGEQAVTAFGALESQLVQGADRTRNAHEEARTALDALGQQAHSSQPELEAAADEMTAAVHSAQQAITEGQTLVAEGVTSLTGAMTRLLGEAQQRLTETYHRLDELRSEQEKAVSEALSALETGREKVEQEVTSRLDGDVKQAVDPELDSVFEALSEMGQQVLHLQGDTESRRESFEKELAELEERIPPLKGGVDQVQHAAKTLGVDWP